MASVRLLFLVSAAVLSACNADADGDGLTWAEERDLGTDPDEADTDGDGLTDGDEIHSVGTDALMSDTDGDGYDDGAELAEGSDPNNGFSWPEGDCRWPDFSDEAAAAGVEGEGWAFGEVMPNVTFIDAHDGELDLHQYWGFVVVLELSAGWCNPCRAVAEEAEEFFQEFKDRGFVLIHILMNGNVDGEPSDKAFLEEWAGDYGLTFPVTRLDDPPTYTDPLRTAGTMSGGIPNFIVLDRDLRIDFQTAGWPDTPVRDRVAELIDASP